VTRSIEVQSAEEMRAIGTALASRLRPGDVVVLSGPVGAGKTTLTQGIGVGLNVTDPITSPTFVIAREHRGALDLVHVDAYRLGSKLELDDLDLVSDRDQCVTVVEWGAGLADVITADPDIIELAHGPTDEVRVITLPDRFADLVVPS
jgi:tRNA threonylcarbamoyladenosine biosynthesis protein TsaE